METKNGEGKTRLDGLAAKFGGYAMGILALWPYMRDVLFESSDNLTLFPYIIKGCLNSRFQRNALD